MITEKVDYFAKIRSRVTISPNGCWVEWTNAVNDDDQPVMWIEGKTQSVRAWLRRRFGVKNPVACDTPGCLSPLHSRKGRRTTP